MSPFGSPKSRFPARLLPKEARKFPQCPGSGLRSSGEWQEKTLSDWALILSAIRWCLNYGGISSATRDDEGYTGLHMAAMLGKPRSLEAILDHIRRAHMSKGGGDIRAPKTDKRRKPCIELEEKVCTFAVSHSLPAPDLDDVAEHCRLHLTRT